MPSLAELIQQGSTNLWVFIPTAILLGALHGLEPGHSKTMMASFIIAVRGTVAQAALLGLCAALSHSLVVWVLAAAALEFGNELIAEQAEPYFMLLSAAIVIGVSIWMFIRTRGDNAAAKVQEQTSHGGRIVNTGEAIVELEIFEHGVPPRFRLHGYDPQMQPKPFNGIEKITLETVRAGGERQSFTLRPNGAFLESKETIPEPLEFDAVMWIGRDDDHHAHKFELCFSEDDHNHTHAHTQDHSEAHHAVHSNGAYQDAHERAHAEDIKHRFSGQKVTTVQIAMFGLTGGLVPCPASVTILMICLHLKRFTLGAAMVTSFSIGLAISLVSVGVIAAWGASQIDKRVDKGNLSSLARKMPYFSTGLMALVGVLMGIQGVLGITG